MYKTSKTGAKRLIILPNGKINLGFNYFYSKRDIHFTYRVRSIYSLYAECVRGPLLQPVTEILHLISISNNVNSVYHFI